jgi:hypothetical protein
MAGSIETKGPPGRFPILIFNLYPARKISRQAWSCAARGSPASSPARVVVATARNFLDQSAFVGAMPDEPAQAGFEV